MAKKPTKVTELPDGPVDENGLTPRQRKILIAIKNAMETNGYPPSMREIGEAAGLSSPRVLSTNSKLSRRRAGSAVILLVVAPLRSSLLAMNALKISSPRKLTMFLSLDVSLLVDRFLLNRMLKNSSHFPPPWWVKAISSC
jgi:hypothetical protein